MTAFNYKAHRFYRKFARTFLSFMGKTSRYVVVACSGGPDSMALVDLLQRFSQEHPTIPVVVHVNHHLRGRESERDARFVAAFCKARHLPYLILDAKPALKGNLQTEARTLRYAALTAVAEHLKTPWVVTAHHANDQAETVLLMMLRGSRKLGGMPAKRALNQKVSVLRPLLGYSREELRQYIKEAMLSFVKDSSNDSLGYTRNWVRKKLIPLLAKKNPQIVEALCRVANGVKSAVIIVMLLLAQVASAEVPPIPEAQLKEEAELIVRGEIVSVTCASKPVSDRCATTTWYEAQLKPKKILKGTFKGKIIPLAFLKTDFHKGCVGGSEHVHHVGEQGLYYLVHRGSDRRPELMKPINWSAVEVSRPGNGPLPVCQ